MIRTESLDFQLFEVWHVQSRWTSTWQGLCYLCRVNGLPAFSRYDPYRINGLPAVRVWLWYRVAGLLNVRVWPVYSHWTSSCSSMTRTESLDFQLFGYNPYRITGLPAVRVWPIQSRWTSSCSGMTFRVAELPAVRVWPVTESLDFAAPRVWSAQIPRESYSDSSTEYRWQHWTPPDRHFGDLWTILPAECSGTKCWWSLL